MQFIKFKFTINGEGGDILVQRYIYDINELKAAISTITPPKGAEGPSARSITIFVAWIII